MASFFDHITGEKQKGSITIQGSIPTRVLEFDAVISEMHIGNAITSEHPVENGSDMTDHVQRTPEELQIVGLVSDTPIIILASLRAEPAVSVGGDPQNRVHDAYAFLKEVKDTGQLVSVSTTLRDYTNMVIVGLVVPRDKDKGRVLEASLTLKEILIATTEQVAPPEPVSTSRASKTNQGRKTKTPAPPAVEASSTTLLEDGANFIAGIVG